MFYDLNQVCASAKLKSLTEEVVQLGFIKVTKEKLLNNMKTRMVKRYLSLSSFGLSKFLSTKIFQGLFIGVVFLLFPPAFAGSHGLSPVEECVFAFGERVSSEALATQCFGAIGSFGEVPPKPEVSQAPQKLFTSDLKSNSHDNLASKENSSSNTSQSSSPLYTGEGLNHIAFPLGGIGAGMICLEGTGFLSHVSLHHHPNIWDQPKVFSAITIKGSSSVARVLEGPVPRWKTTGSKESGRGLGNTTYGLPRFESATFSSKFPFAKIQLKDSTIPLQVEITGWSPFVPGDADNSSLPVAALEFTFQNLTDRSLEAVYSFHAANFMGRSKSNSVQQLPNGFYLYEPPSSEKPYDEGAFAAVIDDPQAKVDCRWFRGGWFDAMTMLWKTVEEGSVLEGSPVAEGKPSEGGSIFVPFSLQPKAKKVIRLRFAWYVPESDLRIDITNTRRSSEKPVENKDPKLNYRPWYTTKFHDIKAVADYWKKNYDSLRQETEKFTSCFYDTNLPGETIEAIAANLAILKSPTVMRKTDGRFWGWEGCGDEIGLCEGSCTHVWNYAQAVPHLFPDLERSLRQTEFFDDQNKEGHQNFRASIPIQTATHNFHAAADGQLGGIMKVYRDWRISGDTEWLRTLWPRVKQSLDYCIATWDPLEKGIPEEPQHNTYDIEFWGPNGMIGGFYLGALKAMVSMGHALDEPVTRYEELFKKGKQYLEGKLFNGEYFFQEIQWKGLKTPSPVEVAKKGGKTSYLPEAMDIFEREGPKYQYGKGCLADGILGAWMAEVCGVGELVDPKKVQSHLMAVYRYNLRKDFSTHANPQRPGYALGHDGGLLLCTWPKGEKLSLPFPYSDEVWTGIEYQVAGHLIIMGKVEEGLEIVRICRNRYNGQVRNPFSEYEWGYWYARAMSSYGLLQALTGIRYDAIDKTLIFEPKISGDFRSFLSTATGYGTVGIQNGKPFFEVKSGKIEVKKMEDRRVAAVPSRKK